jgi:hypothetical protein
MDWVFDCVPGVGSSVHPRKHLMWENRMMAQPGGRQDLSSHRPLTHFLRRRRRRPMPLPMAPAPTAISTQPLKSLDEATVFLVNHLDKNKAEITGLIRHLRSQGERVVGLPHVLPLWFQQLGNIVFAGQINLQNVPLREREFRQRDGVHPHSKTVEIHIHVRLLLAYHRQLHVGIQALAVLLH